LTALSTREVEHKFQVSGSFQLPPLDSVVPSIEDRGATTLTATYYDTSDLRLARAGITLRQRSGGDDAGWHLKLPVSRFSPVEVHDAGAPARDEIHLAAAAAGSVHPAATGSTATNPPGQLVWLVRAITRHAAMAPIATLVTERTTWLLRDASGAAIGELVDDLVAAVDTEGATTSTFREVELEERPASTPELVRAIGAALTAAGAEAGRFVPKVVRALGSSVVGRPEIPERAELGPGASAQAVIVDYLADQVRALRAADLGVRRDAEDAVHQLRVAARRFRSCLRAFQPLFDRTWADELRAEIGWMASKLGSSREGEVLLERLAEITAADARPAVRLLESSLADTLAEARSDIADTLNSGRYLDLHDALIDACNQPPTTAAAEGPAVDVLLPRVAKAWKRLRRKVRNVLAAEQKAPASDAAWHATRIAAKRARYAVDAVCGVFGPAAAELGRQLAGVTDILGEHQDAAIAAELAAELAGGMAQPDDAETIFALGVVHDVERDQVTRARREFADRWPQVADADPLQWSSR
jgi:CHAD domain-containing protein